MNERKYKDTSQARRDRRWSCSWRRGRRCRWRGGRRCRGGWHDWTGRRGAGRCCRRSGWRHGRQGFGKAIDPAAEDAYWRQNFTGRPYVQGTRSYDDYGPAYKYGVDNYSRYKGRSFDEVEGDLSRDWGSARGRSSLEWDDARHATRDAWNRLSNTVERAVPGDSDRDGR